MKIGFSFLSRHKSLLGVQVQMGADMVEGRGLPVIQPVVEITFGFIFMYIKLTFNMGKAHSIIDMIGSGAARVIKKTIKDGEVDKTVELSEEEAINELKKHDD